MHPYPRRSQLDLKKKVYNYRLNRARRVVESVFGILVARWRIFRRPINTYIKKAEIMATVCLHIFIISKELLKSSRDRRYLYCSDNNKRQPSLAIRSIVKQANNVMCLPVIYHASIERDLLIIL